MKLSIIVVLHFPARITLGGQEILTATLDIPSVGKWEEIARLWLLENLTEKIKGERYDVMSISHSFIPEG